MPELIDAFGETVTDNGGGSYSRGGVAVEAASGAAALVVFAGMAPEGWSPPAPIMTDPLTFIRRFTPAEQSSLMAANPVWGVLLAAAGTVNTADPLLLADLNAAVAGGALTADRMTQVLNLGVASP